MGELTGYLTRKTTDQEILHKIQILIFTFKNKATHALAEHK